MVKYLTINGFGAGGKVEKVKGGYDVVITISFNLKASASRCLDSLDNLEEASNETIILE